jgi:predicted acetyltransferase
MTTPPGFLRPLRHSDRAEALAAHAELAAEGFDFLLGYDDGDDWDGYLELLAAQERGERLPRGSVPHTFRVADDGGTLVGRVSIRHELNAYLAAIGGHIGYAVRPGARRRGHAGRILREALEVAAGLGIPAALLTCDEDNVGSVRTIEAAGGVFEDAIELVPGVAKRRYWVETRP